MSIFHRTWTMVVRPLAIALITTLLITFVLSGYPSTAYAASSNEIHNITESIPVHAISPKPQSLQVTGDGFPVGSKVLINRGPGTDSDTFSQLKQWLQQIGVTTIVEQTTNQDPATESPVSIWIGGQEENTASIAQLQSLGYTWPNTLNTEGYVLASGTDATGKHHIVLAGETQTGTFYALQSLKQLLTKDAHGAYALPEVYITDWPTMPYRGVVEGFYGKPWSHADRLDHMDFYGTNKLNTYIYAPKDDEYHRSKWREPYPAAEYERLRELVQRAQENKVQFTFAISPGGDMVFSSNEDFELLKQKAQAAWDIGVRSFAVYMDDIDPNLRYQADKDAFGKDINPSAAAQTHVLNKFNQEFIKTHPGAGQLITVPTDYFGLNTTPYIDRFADLLDSNILVHWTGKGVFADTVTTGDADKARAFYKHDILFWDNFPVNDTSRDKLYLAPLQGRDLKLYEHGIVGFVSNPTEDPELSKLSIYNYGDYTWNPDSYDHERSWLQSLAVIGGKDAEVLKTLAENNYSTPVTPNREGLIIKPLIDQFWQRYDGGQDLLMISNQLNAELVKLQRAITTIQNEFENKKLVQEMSKHLMKLDLQTRAASEALQMLLAQHDGYNQSVIIEHRTNMMKYVDAFRNMPDVRNNQPIYSFITRAIAENDKLWEKEDPVQREPISSLVTYGDYTIDRMLDSDPNSFYWAHGQVYGMDTGEYFGIDLKEIRRIRSVEVVMDTGDFLNAADIEISLDGRKWIKVGSSYGKTKIQLSLNNYNARYVRVVAAARNDKWVKVYDFNVRLSRSDVEATTTLSYDNFIPNNIVDNNPNTYFWSGQSPKMGDEVRLNFSKPESINHLTIMMDYLYNVKKGVVEYTIDGISWHRLFDLNGEGYKIESFPEVTAQAIRIRMLEKQDIWLQVFEILFSKTEPSDKVFPAISLDSSTLRLTKGGSLPLQVFAAYPDGTQKNVTSETSFVSSNPAVANVSPQGTVTGAVYGTADIIASYLGQYQIAQVTVVLESDASVVTRIALDSTAYTLKVGEVHASVVEAVYANGERRVVTQDAHFEVQDASIASVNEAGEVTGVALGETFMKVSYGDYQQQVQIKVVDVGTPEPKIERIQFKQPSSSVELSIGGIYASVVEAVYSNGLHTQIVEPIEYASSVPHVASVNSQGVITAHSVGHATIQAVFKGFETSVQVKVKQQDTPQPPTGGGGVYVPTEVTGIELNLASKGMKIGEKQQLKVLTKLSDGSRSTASSRVIYTSSNSQVASIDSAGVITANAAGKAKITAYYDKYDASIEVTVTNEQVEQETREVDPVSEGQASTDPFNDMNGHWAASIVNKAVGLGFVKGYEDGTFRPNAVVTRAEMAAWLGRALKLTVEQGQVPAFSDAEEIPDWAISYVIAAVHHELWMGYEDKTFRPNQHISREEMAAIVTRAKGLSLNTDGALSFKDKDRISAWAKPYVAAAVQSGLIQGKGDNVFAPKELATRAEAVTIIVNLLKSLNV